MKIEQFIEEFNKSQNKETCIKKHVVNDYMSYAQKVSVCNKIVELSSHKYVEDKKVFSLDSTMRYMLFVYAVIDRYTDIELGQGESRVNGFDLLEKHNVMYFISKCLGDEFKRLETILKMRVDDAYSNERDLASFLETKIDALNIVLEQMGKIYEQKNKQYVSAENKDN